MAAQLACKGGTPLRSTPFPLWPVHDQREEQLLLQVLHSGNWSFNGPVEQQFSQRFAEFCGAKEAFCVSNGSVSLEIALRALGIGPGDEVIVPSLTWTATAEAVINVGATLVLADVNPWDWCLSLDSVKANLSSRTKALIPVHLYSQMADMDAILAFAKEHSLKVIEDCAHTHGSQWNGKAAGTLGNIGSFSFQQSKSMTSGEGGMLITQDENLAALIYGFKNCGRPFKSGKHTFGNNHRLTEFQAAILLAALERLPQQIAKRQDNVTYFEKQITRVPGISMLPWKSQVTRRGMYGLSLTYQSSQFNDIPRDVFLKAIRAEGVLINPPYEVIYRASNWTPGEHLLRFPSGVNPRKVLCLDTRTPVAESIDRQEGLVIPHQLFLGTQKDMDDLVGVFEKVHAGRDELSFDSIKHKGRALLKRIGI